MMYCNPKTLNKFSTFGRRFLEGLLALLPQVQCTLFYRCLYYALTTPANARPKHQLRLFFGVGGVSNNQQLYINGPSLGLVRFTMTTALRPILRSAEPTSTFLSLNSTTYICYSCRNARLLRRPKRPYTFTQLVTLSDGSAFTLRTTSPLPVYRSTRDTRNAPLWNPSSKDLLNVEEDEAGRLAGFRARFGRGFDAGKEPAASMEAADSTVASSAELVEKGKAEDADLEDNGFAEEEDVNLLEMISSFGQQGSAGSQKKGSAKGK